MRTVIVSFILLSCLLGCQGAQPSLQTPSVTSAPANTAVAPANEAVATVSPSVTTVTRGSAVFSVSADNKVLPWNGGNYTLETTAAVEIQYPPDHYSYLFKRQDGKVSALPEYQAAPQNKGKRAWISLKEFNQDVDWFFVTSGKAILSTASDVAAAIGKIEAAKASGADSPVMIKPVLWRIYTMDTIDSAPVLGMRIEISQAPFSLQLLLQQPGETSFREFVPASNNLPEGGHLQIKVNAKRATHLGVFLCYVGKERPEKIVQIFPAEDSVQTLPLAGNASVTVPATGGIAMEKSDAKRVIYCFPSEQPLDCQELNKWLSEKARGYAAIESLEHEEVIPIRGEEGVDRVEAEYRHMRVDLQPQKN